MQIDAIEALEQIVQYGIVDVIDGGGKLVVVMERTRQ